MFSRHKQYILFSTFSILLVLLSWWGQAFFLLPGLIIVFDIFISRIVPWRFWKNMPNRFWSKFFEWSEFVILAFLCVLFLRTFIFRSFFVSSSSMEPTLQAGDNIFVNKVVAGPRFPSRPVSLPFLHNSLPWIQKAKSYSNLVRLPYHRLPGFRDVKRNDIVVFNFPEGDSSVVPAYSGSYYYLKRKWGERYVQEKYNVLTHPVEKREYYIKRCVGLPGDIIQVKKGVFYLNGSVFDTAISLQYKYFIKTESNSLTDSLLDIGIINNASEIKNVHGSDNLYELSLTKSQAEKVKGFMNVIGLMRFEDSNPGLANKAIFPSSSQFQWTMDNYGPLYVPARGHKVLLNKDNLPLYQRIIEVYEGNKLDLNQDSIFINGQYATSYAFQMDYFFLVGDNRHYSTDSRFWGFVPEDHIEGVARFVWFSFNKKSKLGQKVNWNRFFKKL